MLDEQHTPWAEVEQGAHGTQTEGKMGKLARVGCHEA